MTPEPVYPHELPLCELKTVEALLVTTARLFLFRPHEADPWWEGLWRATQDLQTIFAFEQLLRTMVMSCERPLDLRCPCNTTLGVDEGRFLQMLALCQNRRPDAALAMLREWLPPAAARLASASARDLARLLTYSRLTVPWRCPIAAGHLSATHADAGLMLVQ